ncbi:MAG: type II toxin-antitoxin system VapC family toxin [Actinomycetota bacterium]
MTDRSCVVDASAVLAWLFRERGDDAVERILHVAVISAVNLGEVLYRAAGEGMRIETLAADLEAYGLETVPFTSEDAPLLEEMRRAARRQKVTVSLGDCCCLATAVRLGLPVVGGDQPWERLRIGVDIHPIR